MFGGVYVRTGRYDMRLARYQNNLCQKLGEVHAHTSPVGAPVGASHDLGKVEEVRF